jgi:hypothetical protein
MTGEAWATTAAWVAQSQAGLILLGRAPAIPQATGDHTQPAERQGRGRTVAGCLGFLLGCLAAAPCFVVGALFDRNPPQTVERARRGRAVCAALRQVERLHEAAPSRLVFA